ncbi:KdsC family phosphatase [Usitatibacter palustris]|uniref:3-deoxy-D-manno-octulosonate 8-phosphate phosphatase KdsC n=1 Tax=Usitatibacter palustris TaxID=2732487 RepID=A0A6M4H1R0_9PROT|nr:HAD-IIIA family hydrolase [Usitatibacter palustris]QJR13285.1 3-deoxy-D-manno-octulosonate 8-phosphate phosphatase KdsC [Usitatibacter palustris]
MAEREAELRKRAKQIRLAIFDVDGVLTDGSLWFGPDGEALKVFNILDGHGLKMLAEEGIATAILSGRSSPAVTKRAAELGIAHVIQGATDKRVEFDRLRAKLGVEEAQCAFVGDDLPDLPVMQRCGLAVAVANAVELVKAAAHYVTDAPGGRGAVREFSDLVLAARRA